MERYLFVIDYQKDFVDGALGFPGAEALDAGIAAKVRDYGPGRVFYTMDTHFPDYLETREGRQLPVPHCIKDSPGWQLYGETARALDEVGAAKIEKLTFGMDLSDPAVRAKLPVRAEAVELVGLVSNICVISNACVLQSCYPAASIVVDAALTASFDLEAHEKALDVMRSFQVEVINDREQEGI